MARGELARSVTSGGEGDEIGRLTFALEEMRRALRDKLRSTEEVNLDLEREVQRRTADLAKKNRELADALEKLTRAQSQLVRSEKMASIGQLVAGIAHEINNPVNAVANTVGPLREAIAVVIQGPPPAPELVEATSDIEHMMRVIQNGARRTQSIVQALHNYSRTDDERVVELDINRGLDDSLELLRHHLKGHIQVGRRYDAVGRIRGHAGQLNQVFMNLLTNAAQAVAGREARTSRWSPGGATAAWSSRWSTTARASPRRSCRASSTPSSPPRRSGRARGSACRSSTPPRPLNRLLSYAVRRQRRTLRPLIAGICAGLVGPPIAISALKEDTMSFQQQSAPTPGAFDLDRDQDGAVLDDVAGGLATLIPKAMGAGVGLIPGPFGTAAKGALTGLGKLPIPAWAETMGDFWSDFAGTRGEPAVGATDPAYLGPDSDVQTPGSQLRDTIGDVPASLISGGIGAFSGGLAGGTMALGGAGLLTGAAGTALGGAGGGILGGAGGGLLGGVGGGLAGAATGAVGGATLGAALGPLGMLAGGLLGGLGGGVGGGLFGASVGGTVGATGGAALGSLGGGVLGTMALPLAGVLGGGLTGVSGLFDHFAD